MVTGSIKNASQYYGIGGGVETALKYLQTTDFSQLSPQRVEIDGTAVYALVQHYQTKPVEQGVWEAHRKYIDIHFLVEGTERIGCANIGKMRVTQEYDTAEDYLLFAGNGDFLTMDAGFFALCMPEDVHMPCIAVSGPTAVKKVVVKVKV